MNDKTITFSLGNNKENNAKTILTLVYDALMENAGYILSDDPTYITTHNNARNLIQKIDRYELLKMLIKSYIGN